MNVKQARSLQREDTTGRTDKRTTRFVRERIGGNERKEGQSRQCKRRKKSKQRRQIPFPGKGSGSREGGTTFPSTLEKGNNRIVMRK